MKKIIIHLFAVSLMLITIISHVNNVNAESKTISLYQKGLEMTKQAGQLAADKTYTALMSADYDTEKVIAQIGKQNYSKPKAVYEITGLHSAYMNLLIRENNITLSEMLQMNELLQKTMKDRIASSLPTQINSQNGMAFLAASVYIFTADTFIFKGLDKPKTYFYLYDGKYGGLVSYIPHEDDIVQAYANIVMNPKLPDLKSPEDTASFFKTTLGLTNLKIKLVKQ